VSTGAAAGGRVPGALARLPAVAGGAAAAAVGRLLGREVSLAGVESREAPDAAGLAAACGAGEVVCIEMALEGARAGRLLLAVGAADAERVAGWLVPEAPAGTLDALGESALVEAANIAGSAFVSALARALGGAILHRVPRLTRGAAGACLAELAVPPGGPAVLARLEVPGAGGARGILLFLPDAAMVRALETA